jgi:hypothetical protein
MLYMGHGMRKTDISTYKGKCGMGRGCKEENIKQIEGIKCTFNFMCFLNITEEKDRMD